MVYWCLHDNCLESKTSYETARQVERHVEETHTRRVLSGELSQVARARRVRWADQVAADPEVAWHTYG